MKDRLVFLEFEEETHAYINKNKNNSEIISKSIIIPLSLSARLILQENKIPFKTTLDYFDSDAHSRALIRSEEWLKKIEGQIMEDIPLAAELCFCTRPLFNYLLWIAEIIANASEKHQILNITTAEGVLPKCNHQWKLMPQENFIGFLAKGYAVAKNINYKPLNITLQCNDLLKQPPADIVDNYIHYKPGIIANLLKKLIQNHLKKYKTILLSSSGYSLGKLMGKSINQIPNSKIKLIELDMDTQNINIKSIIKLIIKLIYSKFSTTEKKKIQKIPLYIFQPKSDYINTYSHEVNNMLKQLAYNIEGPWRKQFEYRNIDLAPIIVYKLRNGISKHLESTAHKLGRLENLLEIMSPEIVFSPYSGNIYTWLGHICTQKNIPSVMVTHGTHIPPKNNLEKIEHWRLSRNLMLAPTYKYTVAQSPWATRHADFYNFEATTLNTGPLLYAYTKEFEKEKLRMDLGIPVNGKLVVYAVSQRKRSSVKFHVFETEDEYLKDMADLVNAINKLPNVYFIIKLHPSSEFSEVDIRSVLPFCSRLRVLHKEPFFRVLSATDVLVSYSSTTIEEAVLNKIPVVLYDRWDRYCHLEAFDCDSKEPEEWQADAVYYARNPLRLPLVLSHALDMSKTAKTNNNLYKKHLFSDNQYKPLSFHIEKFLKK